LILNIYVTGGHIIPTRYTSFANRKQRVISHRRGMMRRNGGGGGGDGDGNDDGSDVFY